MPTCLIRGREGEGRFLLIRRSRNNSRVRPIRAADSQEELVATELIYDTPQEAQQLAAAGGDPRRAPALNAFAAAPQLRGRECRIFSGTGRIIDQCLRIDDGWVGE